MYSRICAAKTYPFQKGLQPEERNEGLVEVILARAIYCSTAWLQAKIQGVTPLTPQGWARIRRQRWFTSHVSREHPLLGVRREATGPMPLNGAP